MLAKGGMSAAYQFALTGKVDIFDASLDAVTVPGTSLLFGSAADITVDQNFNVELNVIGANKSLNTAMMEFGTGALFESKANFMSKTVNQLDVSQGMKTVTNEMLVAPLKMSQTILSDNYNK